MLSVLHHRDFRLLWAAQSASVVGDALVIIAIGLFVTRLTDRPSDVGLVLASYSVPLVLFLLVGGVVADRLPRHRVMVVSAAVRAVLHATLAVLILTGSVRIWHMVCIGTVFGTAEAFARPASTGLIPQTVPEDEIQPAQALTGLSNEIATIASPALATALVLGVSPAAAFGLDAATFVVAVLLLSRVHPRRRGDEPERSTPLRELAEGFRAVRERAWIWATIAAFSFGILVATAPFFVLGASFARETYGTAAVYGLAQTAWGVGTVTGALLASRLRPARPLRAGLLAAVPWPLGIALYALGPPRPVLYGGMVAAGLGIGLFIVWWETALATHVPPPLLSRVSAWDWMGSLALLPVGYLLAGPLGERYGTGAVLLTGGLLAAGATAAALLPRSTRRLPARPPPPLATPALPGPLGPLGPLGPRVGADPTVRPTAPLPGPP